MKLLLGLIVAVLAVVAFAERPRFSMKPMDISMATSISSLNIGLTTHKDLMIYLDVSDSSTPTMVIRRRNADGVYEPVANFTEAPTFYATTNGKWIATLPPNAGSGSHLFTINANNTLSNSTVLNVFGGFMLSDDTFVAYDPVSELDDGNFTVRTYQYDATNKTWVNMPGTEVVVTSSVYWLGDHSSYRANDNHLIFSTNVQTTNNITVEIYERNADKSWSLIDSVPVNTLVEQPPNVVYNGNDTLFVSYPLWISSNDSTYGIAFLYTKINGVWTETSFRVLELGYKPVGLLGYSAFFVDANTLFISVSLDGYTGAAGIVDSGKILMMTRNSSGIWEPSLDLVGGPGLFALGMSVSDREIIAASLTSYEGSGYFATLYSAPLCFAEPINVTCTNQQVNECSQVDFAGLYTINNPQCGAVTASIDSFSLVNNQAVETQFSFSRGYGSAAYCNATVACPAPPVAPVSNVQVTPSKVSGAAIVQLGIASLAMVVAFL